MSLFPRSIRLPGLLVSLLAGLALLVAVPAAYAEGSPDIGLSVEAAKTVLYGAHSTVTLQASNPSGQPYGYNLSYRAVLPEGISYTGGSTPAPQVIDNEPSTGKTTLIWSNVQDLSPNSHGDLSFEVEHSTSTLTVGDLYKIEAGAYVASEPRFLPQFSATGAPEASSYTGDATSSAETTITALEVTQEEPSPKDDILRGVHDHQVEYTVIVHNTDVNSTSAVEAEDWLPAGLEYLGCGGSGMDHTTDAPTNPGSDEEYPGSGKIEAAAISECEAASVVETVKTDPDGTGPDPEAVYTHLKWSLGTLAPGATVKLKFLAAVPLRENTLTWTKGTPSTSGEAQAADLDNNSGAETRDGQSLTTYAFAAGDYAGTVPVNADDHLTRVAKDMIIEKAASTNTIDAGQIIHWRLTIRSSEYRYNTGIEVTDTLPNGLCPLGEINYTGASQASDSECETTGAPEDLPSSEYLSVSENENGTWTLKWNDITDLALANLQANEVTTIKFSTRTRVHYQEDHKDGKPILANDHITNSVGASTTTNVVCETHTDCETGLKAPIDHERPLSEPISDSDSVELRAEGPEISKEIAATSTASCAGLTYTKSVPVYHPGDLICWKLLVTFPTSLYTQGDQVTDYPPLDAIFNAGFNAGTGQLTGEHDTLSGTTFEDGEAGGTTPGGVVKWTLPSSGIVKEGGQVFERIVQTTATLPIGATPGELQGNLMKFANINTETESFSLRAEADFELQFPRLTLTKQVTEVGGKAIAAADEAEVQGGEKAKLAVTVTNSGQAEAQETKVIDALPVGLGCEAGSVSAISDGGICNTVTNRIEWTGVNVPAEGATTITFETTPPTKVPPNTVYEDDAGVEEYTSATNTGGHFLYVPEKNIEPLIESTHTPNAVAADDSAILKVPDASVAKTHTTAINKPGDDAEQATIGEVVEYKVTGTVPAGSAVDAATLTDPDVSAANERLVLVPGSVKVALPDDAEAASEFTTAETDGSPSVAFPAEFSAAAGGGPQVVEMSFDAYVANVSKNTRGGSIPNTGELTWEDPTLGKQTLTSPTNDVPIVEPTISIKDTNNGGTSVHGGQHVEYSLEIKDASSASPAYGNKLVETVPTGVTPIDAEGKPLANGEKTADGGVWSESSRTITWELATLESGEAHTFHYLVEVNEKPVSGDSLTDKAVVTTTSLPGTTEEERNRRRTEGTGYKAEVPTTLTPGGPTIAKTSDSTTATIGHRITYTLTVTLPAEVTSFDDTVIDTLPDSLDFDEYLSSECTSGCGSAPLTIETYKPKVTETGTTVGWYFGDLESTSEARTVKLVYRADVRSTHRHGGAEVKSGEEIKNSAAVYYDKTKKLTFAENSIPATTAFEEKSASASTTGKVVEPKIELVKEAAVDKGAFSTTNPTVTDSDTIEYRLKVTNEGNSPADDVAVGDTLPSSLTDVVAGAIDLEKDWTEGEPTLKWKIPTIAAGETVELTYEAKLVPARQLKAGQEIANSAVVPNYFGVSEVERQEGLKNFEGGAIGYREYTGPTAKITATVAMPAITIEKTTGATGFPSTADAEVGQPFTWRVVVKNTSTVAAKKLSIIDTLPANWEYMPGSASFAPGGVYAPTEGGALASGVSLTWDTNIELGPGESTVLTYQAEPTLAAETTPGTGVPNLNSASASVTDAAGNTEDAEGPFVAGPATATAALVVPQLSVTKVPTKARVNAGEGDSYTVTVENTGQGAAHDVKVLDTLPSGMTYQAETATATPSTGFSEVSDTGSRIEWEIGEIEAGKSVEINVPVGTEAGLAPGTTLTNTVAAHSAEETTPQDAEGTIEVTGSADILATKRVVGPNQATPGENLTYEISAINAGPSTAHEVKLVDKLPSGVSYVSSTNGCSQTAGTVTCEAAELELGESASFQIVVAVSSATTGTISNTVNAESATPDPNLGNNEATVETPTHPSANLRLVKTALTKEVLDGQQARYSLTATNEGPSDAALVKIEDYLPAGLTFLSETGASCGSGSNPVQCELGTLESGQSKTVEIVVGTDKPGIYANTALISSPTEDPEPANNTSMASLEVLPAADLSIEKTASPTEVELPGEVTYALKIENHGPDEAQKVLVHDELPAGERYLEGPAGCSDAGQKVTCSLGALANGASSTIDLKVKVGLSLGEQTVTNTAEVSSETGDPNPANNTSSAEIKTGPAADVAITKQGPSSVVTGESITWKLDVANHGPSTAHDVTVTDPLPTGVTYTSSTASQGTCAIASGTLTCELGTLSNGGSAEVTVTATVTAAPGQIQNTATVSAEEPDPEPENNTSTATTTVTATPSSPPPSTPPSSPPAKGAVKAAKGATTKTQPHLDLKVSVNNHAITPGAQIVYHLTLTNTGKGTASDPIVCDRLPSQTTVVSLDGGKLSKGEVCYQLPKLAPGKKHTFKLVLRANSNAHGTILNPASVRAHGVKPVRVKVRRPVHGAVKPHAENGVTG